MSAIFLISALQFQRVFKNLPEFSAIVFDFDKLLLS